MKIVRTFKLKITSKNPKFLEVATNYLKAINWLSQIIYQRKYPVTPPTISREFYGTIREKFHLPSQLTCSLFRHVYATYTTSLSANLTISSG
jgi:hypothetical protein